MSTPMSPARAIPRIAFRLAPSVHETPRSCRQMAEHPFHGERDDELFIHHVRREVKYLPCISANATSGPPSTPPVTAAV